MKNTFFYLSIILLFFLFSCCNDCKDHACPRLTTEETSWFPYNENDTLIFSNTASDSLFLFPLKSYGNSATLNTPNNGDECNKYCIAGMNIYSYYYINNVEIFYSAFVINKIKDILYVVISPSGCTVVNYFDPYQYFDLSHAIRLDTLSINGNLIENVHHYTCYPQQEEVAETFVKKGIGLVKIVFRNGQDFELEEHIKAK